MVGKRGLAGIAQQLIDGVDGAADDPFYRPHAHPFAEEGENMGALGGGQLVHALIISLVEAYSSIKFTFTNFLIPNFPRCGIYARAKRAFVGEGAPCGGLNWKVQKRRSRGLWQNAAGHRSNWPMCLGSRPARSANWLAGGRK